MSIKFFSGLQDLLGLYDSSAAGPSSSSSTSNGPHSSPTAPIPPTNGLFGASSSNTPTPRKKSAYEANTTKDEDNIPISKCSHDRSVHFPEDGTLITGYCVAPSSPFHYPEQQGPSADSLPAPSIDEIQHGYRRACERAGIQPLASVERQLGYLHHAPSVRQENLDLKGERVTHAHMEALEEIFRRVQFDSLDFEYTFMDDEAAISLAEMLEFYDSTHKLNLSFNREIQVRGWTAIFKAVRNCSSLQVLNLRYTSMSDKALPTLCRCLRNQPQPALGCLHLENIFLSGKNLLLLVCALKVNTTLKELYLGENNLQSTDGQHLVQLITANTSIQMLDLRNNQLGDTGLRVICDALKSPETLRRSSLTALVLWNNKISSASMDALALALRANHRLETLNIGSNPLGETGIEMMKSALGDGTNLHRLGLQNTKMNCQSAITLAECLADNTTMVRVDLRDNPGIGSAGMLALHSAMKMNNSITLLNLDQSCADATSVKARPYQDEFLRIFDEIRQYCERNKALAISLLEAHAEQLVEPEEDADLVIVSKEDAANAEADLSPSSCQPPPLPSLEVVSTPPKPRFMRSSSLTCTETVSDINERIRQMSGSTHSLDDDCPTSSTSCADSLKTVKKSIVISHPPLMNADWGSLPALPQADPESKPAVKKTRRFSVSPSSSTFEVNKVPVSTLTPLAPTVRPVSLAIDIPSVSESSSMSRSLPSSLNLWPPPATLEEEMHQLILKDGRTRVSGPLLESRNLKMKREGDDNGAESEEKVFENLRARRRGFSESDEQIEQGVQSVVNDLINYIVYEETSVTERKASILLLRTSLQQPPDPEVLLATLREESAASTPATTPSRMMNIAEELSEETDEQIVASVVRNMVREVMRREKEELRQTLDRRRKGLRVVASAPNFLNMTTAGEPTNMVTHIS